MKAFGHFESPLTDKSLQTLLYTDWHCSLYSEGNNYFTDNLICKGDGEVIISCISDLTKANCDPKSICSNSSHVFILSKDDSIVSFSKSNNAVKTLDIPKYRAISVNDEDLYCVSGLFCLYIVLFYNPLL